MNASYALPVSIIYASQLGSINFNLKSFVAATYLVIINIPC